MLLLVGTVDIKPAKMQGAEIAVKELMAESRKEDGCVAYTFSRDLSEPDRLHLFECWASQEACAAHGVSSHMAKFLGQMGGPVMPSLKGMNIDRYEVASIAAAARDGVVPRPSTDGTSMLVFAGTVDFNPAKMQVGEEVVKEMMVECLKENGCVVYVFSRDLSEPGRFHLFECWASEEVHTAHSASPHMAKFQRLMGASEVPLVKGMSIDRYEISSVAHRIWAPGSPVETMLPAPPR